MGAVPCRIVPSAERAHPLACGRAVVAGDVLIAINDKPTKDISTHPDLQALVLQRMGAADKEGYYRPTTFKMEVFRPEEHPVDITPAVAKSTKKGGWFSSGKKK